MTVRIEHAGITTVQDRGRVGWAHLGVPTSGAADRASHALANRLVGNSPHAAAFETSGGLIVTALRNLTLVVTGADCDAFVDDTPIRRCVATVVRAGQRVRIDRVRDGMRSYLSVGGGLLGPQLLGSQSHDTLSGIIPLLLAGGIEIGNGPHHGPTTSLDVVMTARRTARLQLQPGPHLELLSPDTRAHISRHSWIVSPLSNRIGIRLTTSSLTVSVAGELPSIPLIRGAVQLTPGGELVVMVADHPTTGGYPVIGVVDSKDVDGLVQLPPGKSVMVDSNF
jgi:biotin-dependent carboxylase-like uncharacterized protein